MLITGKRLGSKLLPEDLSLDIKTRNNTKLDQTPSHKLLGVHLDQDLNFDEHVDSVCNKLSKRIGLLRSIKHLLTKQERIIQCNSIIKPTLMYGSVVWTKTSNENIRRVFRLLKRAARVIPNVGLREERTVTIFNKLNWIPFYDESNINKCCIVYKCLQGIAAAYLVNRLSKVSEISSRSTRYSDINLRCPRYTRETEGGKTFTSTVSKLWNSLPVHIRRSPNLISFKRELFNHQKSQYIGLDHFSIS